MSDPTPNRRDVLKGIAAGSASLAFAGYASASSGEARYVTVAGRGAVRRLERDGFEVKRTLADDSVMILEGPGDAAADVRAVEGVEAAARDVRFRLEEPEETALPEETAESGGVESDWYENLWDKQNSEAVAANDVATGDGSRIGIIDTGVDYAHPDLIPNLDEDAGRLFREGRIRSGQGEDIVVNNPAENKQIQRVDQHVASDVNGHGTHVAGIAAADPESGVGGDFGSGVQGVAPDADIVSYRVFWWIDVSDEGEDPVWEPTTTSADILTSIDFGAAQGLDAVNLSLGTPPFPPRVHRNEVLRTLRLAYERTVRSAVNRGTVVVASAGNANTDLQRRGLFSLPNSTKGAMSISALAPNDERAFFSNYGTNEIDVGAGGGGYETLFKTLLGATEWSLADPFPPLRVSNHPLNEGDTAVLYLTENEEGETVILVPSSEEEKEAYEQDPDIRRVEEPAPAWPYPFNLVFSTTSPLNEDAPYGWKAGTSMSAPNTAGLVALVRELEPDANPSQVESVIKKGAEGGDGRSDPDLGAGRINALNTVEELSGGGNGTGGGNGRGN